MDFEFEKENVIRIENKGVFCINKTLEGEISTDNLKFEIQEITLFDTSMYITDIVSENDKTEIQGELKYSILFKPDIENAGTENDIDKLIGSISFTKSFDSKLQENTTYLYYPEVNVSHVEYSVLGNKKIRYNIELEIYVKKYAKSTIEYVSNIYNNENFKHLTQNITVDNLLNIENFSIDINELIDPDTSLYHIDSVIFQNATIKGLKVDRTEDEINVKGEAILNIYYISGMDEKQIEYIQKNIPFSKQIVSEDNYDNVKTNLEHRIREFTIVPREDIDGENRLLEIDLKIECDLMILEEKNIISIRDAYMTTNDIQLKKIKYDSKKMIEKVSTQIMIHETLKLEAKENSITKCKPFANIIITNVSIQNGGAIIEGKVNLKEVIFMNNDKNNMFSNDFEIPFRHVENFSAIDENSYIDFILDDFNIYQNIVSENEIEFKFIQDSSINIYTIKPMELVESIEMLPFDEKEVANQPSFRIYFTKDGDTVWDIGKKYNIDTDSIKRINSVTDEDIFKLGQKILVQKTNRV